MRHIILGLLFVTFLSPTTAKADHLPDQLLAAGEPETALAGINLKTTKFDDVIHRYGSPAREQKASNNPAWTGYVWVFPHAKLEIDVNRGSSGTQITDIYVEGNTNGPVGTTGRGLKLGDDIKKLERIYGKEFKTTALKNDSSEKREEFTGVTVAYRRITIQWDSEDFTLTVGLDNKGKVGAMWLILPECYPDGCD